MHGDHTDTYSSHGKTTNFNSLSQLVLAWPASSMDRYQRTIKLSSLASTSTSTGPSVLSNVQYCPLSFLISFLQVSPLVTSSCPVSCPSLSVSLSLAPKIRTIIKLSPGLDTIAISVDGDQLYTCDCTWLDET